MTQSVVFDKHCRVYDIVNLMCRNLNTIRTCLFCKFMCALKEHVKVLIIVIILINFEVISSLDGKCLLIVILLRKSVICNNLLLCY